MAPAQKGQEKADPSLALEQKKQLRPDQRIRKQEAFKNLVEKGNFTRGEFFYLWTGRQEEIGQEAYRARPMLGMIVGRSHDARATSRNILKRRIREIFRKYQDELKKGTAFLVKAKQTRKKPSFKAIREDLEKLFKKAGEQL